MALRIHDIRMHKTYEFKSKPEMSGVCFCLNFGIVRVSALTDLRYRYLVDSWDLKFNLTVKYNVTLTKTSYNFNFSVKKN